MDDVVLRIVASVVCACLFCCASVKLLGAMQQSGYKNGVFLRWLKRRDNVVFNRLAVLALCLFLSATIIALCFSFLGTRAALLISAIPFLGFVIMFGIVDGKYALKVQTKRTGRLCRLFGTYLFVTAFIAYLLIAVLWLLARLNGSMIYALIAYAPFAVMPLLLPFLLCAANAIDGVFENARNEKFVKRAGQVLDESKMIRVAIVGSYGKTSVKNIVKTLLSEKYAVVETPQSFNTPIGIAKTVLSENFKKKQVFIAEMGARKRGDVAELCRLVKPDYAIFTGVCEQHIMTFGSLENVWKEKSEILRCGVKKAVCGVGVMPWAKEEFGGLENVWIADGTEAKNVRLGATETRFTVTLGGKEIEASVPLLGGAAVENVALAAKLAYEMGMTAEEIEKGIAKLQPVPHRLQLIENGGVYILDDGYNCNPRGAKEAIAALGRFEGRKCVVTPGIVECGVLERSVNEGLGKTIAEAGLDKVILVGDTLVDAVRVGYIEAGGNDRALQTVKTLDEAQTALGEWVMAGDAVLFLNDLPDVY